jgi:thiamine pyrophosphate-dependent acetolactate synthase large subunit-like protein
VHLELPEDIAADEAAADIVPPHDVELPVVPAAAIERAAAMIMGASRPSSLTVSCMSLRTRILFRDTLP